MKKLQSLVFCTLLTPAIILGTGSVLAQQSTDETTQSDQNKQHPMKTDIQKEVDRNNIHGKSKMQNRDYLSSVPANGSQASDLIGANVKTANNEDIGVVDDLIIDKNGQIMAIVISVGGFLGMGEKDVAIGWGHVKISTSAKQELRVDVRRDELKTAPKFEKRD